MTYEQFDKATQIHVSMNEIYALQDVLGNAKGGRYLATIEVGILENPKVINHTKIENTKVINHAKVPMHILKRFEDILWEELDILKTEFNKL